MVHLNNPASRLLEIVKKGQGQPRDKSALEAWGNILSTPLENRSLLLRRIGYVMDLPLEVRTKMEALDGYNPDLYLKWLPIIESAFGMLNFNSSWSNFIQGFDSTVMYGLEISSDLLSRKNPEKTTDPTTLKSILECIEELIAEVSDIEAPPLLQDLILENLINIKQAIEEYSIRGLVPIQRSLTAFLADTVVNNKMAWRPATENIFWEKLWKTISRLGIIVAISVGFVSLGKDAFKAIEYIESMQSEQDKRIETKSTDTTESEYIDI